MDNEALARIEAAIADMRSGMDRRFDDVDYRFDKLEKVIADTRAELRKGDEDTRSQLKVLIERVDDRVKLVAKGQLDHDRRISALENRR